MKIALALLTLMPLLLTPRVCTKARPVAPEFAFGIVGHGQFLPMAGVQLP